MPKIRSHCCQLTCKEDALFTLWDHATHPETATESCLKHVLELKDDKEDVYLLGNGYTLDEQVYGKPDVINLDNPYLVMMCEGHPWRQWPHGNDDAIEDDDDDECAGPGMPLRSSLNVLEKLWEASDEYPMKPVVPA